MTDDDIVLTVARVQEGKQSEIEGLYRTMRGRKAEAIECLDALGVDSEAAFLTEIDGETYFFTYMKARDLERMQERYLASDRELDIQHRKTLAEALAEEPTEVEPLIYMNSPDRE